MIRPATIHDLGAIMALENSSFPDDAWSEQTMATEITSAHNRYFVDDEDGRVVGYGGVRALPGAPDSDIQTIALDPAFRGQGRGRRMLRLLLDQARERGARDTFLEVRDDNEVAQALYLAEGFVEIGRRPRYYKGGIDAIVMKIGLAGRAASAIESSTGWVAEPSTDWVAEPVEASPEDPSTSSGTQPRTPLEGSMDA
ncbi:ribosomal protein S18-alanine N-acetyltransferase [Microbacterium sp. KUDC0406]|uniref:ribosomal protein S18-alanine N-acetyltransferase n=1 Tax=Microbacterium sp. KUDC0406 TaxID=2909588 RepID=UPI001F45957D|nr:ribosomal protein S18-alanine N-acetyltransferase [Microbacterium sp. KUDC0406]UJP08860.1 ribosomal protein S18-alanine N-acetyltransferase [Microbacterium sp. KUDC0406]